MKGYPLLLALCFAACSNVHTPEMPAAPESAQAVDETAARRGNAAGFVKANAENIANYAMKFAKSDGLTQEIQKLLEQAPPSKKAQKNADNPEIIAFLQQNDLKSVYEARGYAPIFVSSAQFSPRVEPLISELAHLEAHGLKLNAQPWNQAREALDGLGLPTEEPFHFTDEEQAVLVDTIIQDNVDIHSVDSVRQMVAGLVKEGTPIPRLREAVASRAQATAQSAKTAARLEVLTADLAMRFAREMSLNNMTHLTKAETASVGKRPTDAKYRAVAEARTKKWLESLARIVDMPMAEQENTEIPAEESENTDIPESDLPTAEEMAKDGAGKNNADDSNVVGDSADAATAQMAAAARHESRIVHAQSAAELVEVLYPPHPAYKKLVEARERYLGMPDWQDVSSQQKMRVGKPYKNVPGLKKRLSIEGYYHGDVSDEAAAKEDFSIYDNDLRAAIQAYYQTHQLDFDEEKGFLKGFWSSLNTPRQTRIEQIEENLRRWHNTQIVDSPYYIFINVPDFHGEIWRDGELAYRFPVVVGNAKKQCSSETKQWKYINATPLMHARMLYVEYNPYWTVPARIEQEEYIEKINADPTWLATHGFEYYSDGGHTVLRQLPAENNALGRVKFIFPNQHSTFLHDSPQKGLFKYPIRAFSHGCMRVWNPLELAKRILQYDGQWYDKLANEIDDLKTRRIILKKRFDVFIDYFTVRVAEDGMVNFLADPYRYVRDSLEPPRPASLKCKPNPKAWIARTSLQGDDVGAEVTDND